ncbi:MAG: VCBS repeat-containing protein, partial [Cloacibacillus sp.]
MHKLQGNKIFWTLTLALFLGAALFCAAKQGVLLKADADEAIALDPLNGLWNSRIIPKHRLMVSSFEQTTEKTNVKTMMGTKEKVVEGKNLNDDYNSPDNIDYTNDGCHDSSNYLPTAIPFALATTEGYVPSSVEISPDFYGITRFNNVPQNIIVTSFIVKKDDMYSQLGFDIYKQGTSGKLAMPKRILIDNIYPAYQFNFKGDGSWKKAEPLGVTTMHDIVAHDWNNDGYSDYAVTFVTAKGGHDTETYMRVMLVDGKKLYSTSNSYLYSDSYTWVNGSEGTKINAGGSIVGGLTAIKPTTSIRMVKGDFDGDGTPELAAFFTAIEGSAADVSRPAKLAVYKIEDPANSSVFTTSTMFSTDHGGSLKANDITGIAAGDIDGDGLDEIAALYTESSASGTTARAKLSILKYNATKKTFDFIVKSSEITLTYNPAGWEDSVSPINASITDLDGDGYGELTWSTVKDDGG